MYDEYLDISFDNAPAPTASYMICSPPRTGSNLLCQALYQSLCAGAPMEYFHPMFMQQLNMKWNNDNFNNYLKLLFQYKTSPNGVFGFKMQYWQYTLSLKKYSLPDLFPNLKYIYLTRKDPVRVAVSYAKAKQTWQWTSKDQPKKPAMFNFEMIHKSKKEYLLDMQIWERFFKQHHIEPLRLDYDQLCDNMDASIDKVLNFLQVDTSLRSKECSPLINKQYDEFSEHAIRKYKRMCRCGYHLYYPINTIVWKSIAKFGRYIETSSPNTFKRLKYYKDKLLNTHLVTQQPQPITPKPHPVTPRLDRGVQKAGLRPNDMDPAIKSRDDKANKSRDDDVNSRGAPKQHNNE